MKVRNNLLARLTFASTPSKSLVLKHCSRQEAHCKLVHPKHLHHEKPFKRIFGSEATKDRKYMRGPITHIV